MPLAPVSTPSDSMAGADFMPPPAQAASVTDASNAHIRFVFFMVVSVGFGVLHLSERSGPSFYSLSFTKSPQGRDFGRTRSKQRIASILRLGVLGAGIETAKHQQTGFGDPGQQLLARPQAEQFGDVGNDQDRK